MNHDETNPVKIKYPRLYHGVMGGGLFHKYADSQKRADRRRT
jgi:hypothetical protein